MSNDNDMNTTNEKKNPRAVSVAKIPQGKSYTPAIRIAGKWLADAGFELGDKVEITYTHNQIIITK